MTKEEKEKAWLVSVMDKVLVPAYIQYRLDHDNHGWDVWGNEAPQEAMP